MSVPVCVCGWVGGGGGLVGAERQDGYCKVGENNGFTA